MVELKHMESWALFLEDQSMCVERVIGIGNKWLTWGKGANNGRVNLVLAIDLL
jgi:hypothetical protein